MKALYHYGLEPKQFELRDVPVPKCGPDDVLIEVKAAAICGSDVATYYNGSKKGVPCISGHEFSGVVHEVGACVTEWKPGDRVVSDNTGYACGKCYSCRTGFFANCMDRKLIGLHMDGAFTNYVRIPGDVLAVHKWALMRIPDSVSFEHAAILDPICNAYMAVAQESQLLPGESVLVFGPGPIGLLAAQICHLMGMKDIILVGLEADKVMRAEIAEKMGVTAFIASDKEDLYARVHEICGPEGADAAIDCAGFPSILQQAMANVRRCGRIVLLGAGGLPLNFSLSDLTYASQSIQGHHAYNDTTWKNCLGLLEHDMLVLDPLITHILPLSEWETGMRLMKSREGTKILLIPEAEKQSVESH
jgi:threonine dehydrogenase-like Zn-dependent dehydrogenase